MLNSQSEWSFSVSGPTLIQHAELAEKPLVRLVPTVQDTPQKLSRQMHTDSLTMANSQLSPRCAVALKVVCGSVLFYRTDRLENDELNTHFELKVILSFLLIISIFYLCCFKQVLRRKQFSNPH